MLIKDCDTFQRIKIRSYIHRPFNPRISSDCASMEILSVGIKFTFKDCDVLKYILAVTRDITMYVLATPIKSRATQVIAEA